MTEAICPFIGSDSSSDLVCQRPNNNPKFCEIYGNTLLAGNSEFRRAWGDQPLPKCALPVERAIKLLADSLVQGGEL